MHFKKAIISVYGFELNVLNRVLKIGKGFVFRDKVKLESEPLRGRAGYPPPPKDILSTPPPPWYLNRQLFDMNNLK